MAVYPCRYIIYNTSEKSWFVQKSEVEILSSQKGHNGQTVLRANDCQIPPTERAESVTEITTVQDTESSTTEEVAKELVLRHERLRSLVSDFNVHVGRAAVDKIPDVQTRVVQFLQGPYSWGVMKSCLLEGQHVPYETMEAFSHCVVDKTKGKSIIVTSQPTQGKSCTIDMELIEDVSPHHLENVFSHTCNHICKAFRLTANIRESAQVTLLKSTGKLPDSGFVEGGECLEPTQQPSKGNVHRFLIDSSEQRLEVNGVKITFPSNCLEKITAIALEVDESVETVVDQTTETMTCSPLVSCTHFAKLLLPVHVKLSLNMSKAESSQEVRLLRRKQGKDWEDVTESCNLKLKLETKEIQFDTEDFSDFCCISFARPRASDSEHRTSLLDRIRKWAMALSRHQEGQAYIVIHPTDVYSSPPRPNILSLDCLHRMHEAIEWNKISYNFCQKVSMHRNEMISIDLKGDIKFVDEQLVRFKYPPCDGNRYEKRVKIKDEVSQQESLYEGEIAFKRTVHGKERQDGINPVPINLFSEQVPSMSPRDACIGRRPTDLQLNFLASKLGSEWEQLAIALSLTQADVYNCKVENSFNANSQKLGMLTMWRAKEGAGATISKLVEVLQSQNIDIGKYQFLQHDEYM